MTPPPTELHRQLVEVAKLAAETGKTAGVSKVLSSIGDPVTLEQVLKWIERMSPLARADPTTFSFVAPASRRKAFSLYAAKSLPYWEMKSAGLPQPTHKLSVDRTGAKQELRAALTRFTGNPSFSTRRDLMALLDAYEAQFAIEGSSTYVKVASGGLPTLGRKR